MQCADAQHEQQLLAYLRISGHFAYALGLGLRRRGDEDVVHELLADTMHWWDSNPEAALFVELVSGRDGAAP